jgi:hypothetical protein
MLLYIMIGQNPKKTKTKKLHLNFWHDVMLEYVLIKNYMAQLIKIFKNV